MPAHEPLTDPLIEESFYAGDAFPQYALLRDQAPVAWNDTKRFWAVSRWDDVMAASTDPETQSSTPTCKALPPMAAFFSRLVTITLASRRRPRTRAT